MAVEYEIGTEGLTPEALSKATARPLIDAGVYEFTVDEITPGNVKSGANAGRPLWLAWLKIANNATFEGQRLPYNIVLPWINPANGRWDVSGLFSLDNLVKGTGVKWQGDFRQAEVQETYRQSLIGAKGFMRVTQKPRKNNDTGEDEMSNQVSIVVAKREGVIQ